MSEWLTVAEVGVLIRLKPRKVYDLVAKRAIPYSRVGAKLVFSREQVQDWLTTQDSQDTRELNRYTAAQALPKVITGSHDPLMDWSLKQCDTGLALLTRGSRDGLERLSQGKASAALIHLPAHDLQSFNLHAVAQAARQSAASPNVAIKPWVLIHWAKREQGLICAKGNPYRIEGFANLAKPRARRRAKQVGVKVGAAREQRLKIGLRQAGAGSREIFDLLCAQYQIALRSSRSGPEWVEGFKSEDDIGLAVLEGRIDAALAVRSVAKRFGLHFIPVLIESLDLLIERKAYFEPGFQSLLNFARTSPFRAQARQMEGYDLSEFGRVRWNAG